jgi:hypothetical protein
VVQGAAVVTLRVVGAGLGRTGTHSLKIALEQLLDGRCYHMVEVFGTDSPPKWAAAMNGEVAAVAEVLEPFVATVDWPACSIWEELAAANPDAIILLSVRDDAAAWWKSASRTIFEALEREFDPAFTAMTNVMLEKFGVTPPRVDEAEAIAAYEAHNAYVRAHADPKRLVEWRGADGWEPICAALGLPVPTEPFPHVNTTDEFRQMTGLDT